MLARRDISRVDVDDGGLRLTLRDLATDSQQELGFDAVILATGYRRNQHHELLAGLGGYLESLTPDRHYCLNLRDSDARIYLQGCCETTHGLSDTLLSVLAVRSREVLESILQGRDAGRPAVADRKAHATSMV